MMITTYVKLLRPHHWVKNLLLLFPPFFAGKILDPVTLEKVFPSLLAFSLAASCGYIINDIRDIEADKKHDVKKNRGMAAGGVSRPLAVLLAVILYITAMLIAETIHGEYRQFQWFVILYLLNSLLYTLFFRNLIIVDIFLIAAGFLLRVLAGGAAFRIPVSSWLFLTVFTVSLLLAAGKRLGELITLGDHAHMHRKTLSKYSQSFLEGILWFSASAA